MSKTDISLNPVDHITVDAIGEPGNRTFYFLGRKGEEVISLLIEKVQLQTLIVGIKDFLDEVNERFSKIPDLLPDYKEKDMQIDPPVDPLFRVGEMGLAYDEKDDMVCIIAKEAQLEISEDEAGTVRYWCTRPQLVALGNWAVVVVERGRPICPQCLQPMEPEGHFCPKKNGHKKNKLPDA